MGEYVALRRQSEPTIQDNGPRVFPFDQPNIEARIVRKNRPDPYKDAIVTSSQLMRQNERIRAADCQRFAGPRGNGSIQALGIAQGHKGTPEAFSGFAKVFSQTLNRCHPNHLPPEIKNSAMPHMIRYTLMTA
jgi:hypothetical protein